MQLQEWVNLEDPSKFEKINLEAIVADTAMPVAFLCMVLLFLHIHEQCVLSGPRF